MWCSNDTFHYMFEAEFVYAPKSLKNPSGSYRVRGEGEEKTDSASCFTFFQQTLVFFSLIIKKRKPTHCRYTVAVQSQPPTVVCKNGSSVGTCTCCMHVFARLAPIRMLGRCLSTKFLHRISGGRLLRVRCWLGCGDLTNSPTFFRIGKVAVVFPTWLKKRKEKVEQEESS